MTTYVLKRLVSGVITIVLVLGLAFAMIRLTGDPAILLAGADATEEDIRAIQALLGTDRPVLVQFVDYMGSASRGDFGMSIVQNRPASQVVLERIPITLALGFLSFVLGTAIAIPLGLLSAMRPNSILDGISRVIAVIGQSVPVFWLGILLILLFSVRWRILPSGGAGTWRHLVMPVLSLSILTTPIVMRVLRSSMLEVLSSDYVRMAKAKGASPARVVLKHALRNASVPVITVMGYRLGFVIGGSVIVETVYSFPGLGQMAVSAVLARDFPVIQLFIVVVAALIVTINFLLDVTYSLVDPRIRFES